MRIVIHDPVILGLYTIQILTDKAGVANLGQYGVLITILDNTVFEPTNTPIFDIICIDPVNYKFRIDKIR